jgi:hypothetical protein
MNSTFSNSNLFRLIDETANIYSFLLNALIDVYTFSDFDIADEEPLFSLDFSKNSSIRKYSCVEDPSLKFDGLTINVFLENDVVSYKIFLTSNLAPNYKYTIRCAALGYKDGFKVFTSKNDLLEECLRLENNAIVESAPTDLTKSEGECSICNMETTLLTWPCHNSHTICEQCTAKIVDKNCMCPFCRSVLPTTVAPKEESTNEDSNNDESTNEFLEEEYDYNNYDYYLDDEEFYFTKHMHKSFGCRL